MRNLIRKSFWRIAGVLGLHRFDGRFEKVNGLRAARVKQSWIRVAIHTFIITAVIVVGLRLDTTVLPLISVYGLIAVFRVIYQVFTGQWERSYQKKIKPPREDEFPMISILVPTYNEEISRFEPTMKSMTDQDYPMFEVIVVDDGSDNSADIKRITLKYGAIYMRVPHGGKRLAMRASFDRMSPKSRYVLTSDSDTTWEPDAARKLVVSLMHDDSLGAVTGYVAVRNGEHSLLTRLIGLRYWIAFNEERAAAGFHNAVNCVSGPLGAYRRDLIDDVKDHFVNQRFNNKECTYGDDRHLTNLALLRGYGVGYSSAVSYTDAPETLGGYIRQQLRWSRSFWREMFWQVHSLNKHHSYMIYDLFFGIFMPLYLLSAMWLGVFTLITGGQTAPLLSYMITIMLMGLIRILEPLIRTRDWHYLYFIMYSYIYFVMLMPVKIYALISVDDGSWGSRLEVENSDGTTNVPELSPQ